MRLDSARMSLHRTYRSFQKPRSSSIVWIAPLMRRERTSKPWSRRPQNELQKSRVLPWSTSELVRTYWEREVVEACRLADIFVQVVTEKGWGRLCGKLCTWLVTHHLIANRGKIPSSRLERLTSSLLVTRSTNWAKKEYKVGITQNPWSEVKCSYTLLLTLHEFQLFITMPARSRSRSPDRRYRDYSPRRDRSRGRGGSCSFSPRRDRAQDRGHRDEERDRCNRYSRSRSQSRFRQQQKLIRIPRSLSRRRPGSRSRSRSPDQREKQKRRSLSSSSSDIDDGRKRRKRDKKNRRKESKERRKEKKREKRDKVYLPTTLVSWITQITMSRRRLVAAHLTGESTGSYLR